MAKYQIKNEDLLRLILKIDAIFGFLLAAIGLSLPFWISDLFGLPLFYIVAISLIILAYSSYTWVIAQKEHLPVKGVQFLVVVNTIWAIATIVLLFIYCQSATGWGQAFLLSELGIVSSFAILQKWQLASIN